jgi:hypothetical protein
MHDMHVMADEAGPHLNMLPHGLRNFTCALLHLCFYTPAVMPLQRHRQSGTGAQIVPPSNSITQRTKFDAVSTQSQV